MRAAVVSSRQQLNKLNSVERDRGAADKSTESVRSRDPGQRERGSRRSGERFLCRLPLVRRRTSAGLSRMWSAIEVGKLFVPPKGDDRFAGLQYSCSRKCFTKHLRLCFLSASGVRKPEKSRTPLFLKKSNSSRERKPPP